MKPIDKYSYDCGVMDAFNEMLKAGVKKVALSHPCKTKAERDALIPYAKVLCKKYGTQVYEENEGLVTDLFPASMNKGTYNLVFYKDEQHIDEYLSIKAKKMVYTTVGEYNELNRTSLAYRFGKLLSYTDEAIQKLIAENKEKEVF